MKDPKITKYFSQKTHPVVMILGVAMIIAGFCIWLFLYWPGLSMPLIFAGGLILLLLNMQTKDSEVDAFCGKAEAVFREAFETRFLNRDPRKREKVEQTAAPVYTTTYLSDGYGILTRCGNDGKVRTSSCQCVGLLIGNAGVKFGQQTFSLISGEEYAPFYSEHSFSELSDVTLSEPIAPHTVLMEAHNVAGETVFRAQISDDANNELAVQNINARIRKAHEAQA